MGRMYGFDVLSGDGGRRRRAVPEVAAEPDLVVEDAESGFCGAVVGFESGAVTLEDRHGLRRHFPLVPAGFLLDGEVVTLRKPARMAVPDAGSRRTASGSVAVEGLPARVARASRIWVEGLHDAALVERIWGADLRIEGVVVEPLDGIDSLAAEVRAFGPGPGRRLGVLVDHLVAGTKESRIVASLGERSRSRGLAEASTPSKLLGERSRSRGLAEASTPPELLASPHVLVTGHPYVDIWQAVKPQRVGIRAWPEVPPGRPWKEGVCAALGVSEPAELWRRILASVTSFRDVETPLIGAMERLIDFVTEPVTAAE